MTYDNKKYLTQKLKQRFICTLMISTIWILVELEHRCIISITLKRRNSVNKSHNDEREKLL